MNANFGVILRREDLAHLLIELPLERKFWGEEVFNVGDVQYEFPPLRGIQMQIYPVTDFVRSYLPLSLQCENIVYAWFSGDALNEYEDWLLTHDIYASENHPFELGLLHLIKSAGECSIMFAPEGERLGAFLELNTSKLIELIRQQVSKLDEAEGFWRQ